MSIRPIQKLLVANRGEIAMRIMKTAKEMGIATVAVFSSADAQSPHTRMADESYNIGNAPARESYLVGERIVEVARACGADAIHPGYGFLSENASFAGLLESEQIRLIGPSSRAMRLLGNKASARKLAIELGIPVVPGSAEPLGTAEEAGEVARKIGYPVLLKAVGGGGGKGMRVVDSADLLASAYRSARSEAGASFGDDRVFLEKCLISPRHIEVQILADHHGNVVHLGERECSIQRRHQKIIEESPSVFVDDTLRDQLTGSAILLAREVGYTNAGTMEFLVDKDRKYYFLEVNTRLQVEHPVTELRTGFDLVREQLRVTEGHPFSFFQSDISFRGSAIECRIYAEDSRNNFFPSTGIITRLRPALGPYVREDRGIEEGSEITTHYDPLLSKVIAWGSTRDEAISRLRNALGHYELYGVISNRDLCLWILQHERFVNGEVDTQFLDRVFTPDLLPGSSEDAKIAAAILVSLLEQRHGSNGLAAILPQDQSRGWKSKRLDELR